MSHASTCSPADLPSPSARPVPRPSRGDGWNVLADVEVFIFAVEAELEAMGRERSACIAVGASRISTCDGA